MQRKFQRTEALKGGNYDNHGCKPMVKAVYNRLTPLTPQKRAAFVRRNTINLIISKNTKFNLPSLTVCTIVTAQGKASLGEEIKS